MSIYVSPVTQPYWQRLSQETRDAIEARVPDGCQLRLTPGHRAKPGTTDVRLVTDDMGMVAGPVRGTYLAGLCFEVLRDRGAARVTFDADGWIVALEDVA